MARIERFHLTCLGGARTVTGSMHLLEVRDKSTLIDCGLFQGGRSESRHRNRHPRKAAVNADAVLLTHAHIGHSGNLPNLGERGLHAESPAAGARVDLR